jgi:hypothetical protein
MNDGYQFPGVHPGMASSQSPQHWTAVRYISFIVPLQRQGYAYLALRDNGS